MHPLELCLHNKLIELFGNCLSTDSNIKKLYGTLATGIDHLIVIDNSILVLQDKYEISDVSHDAISNLIRATNYLMENQDKKIILSLFVSRINIKKGGKLIIEEANKIHPNDIFHCVSLGKSPNECDTIELLADLTIKFIVKHLKIKSLNYQIDDCNNHQLDNNVKLYDHQIDAIKTFKQKYLIGSVKSGIVNLPTGSGKSAIAISMIQKFWKYNKTRGQSVLWITERIEILQSSFVVDENKKDINNNIFVKQFLKNYDYELLLWFNKNKTMNYDELNDILNNKKVFLITNIDSIMYFDKKIDLHRYKLLSKDKFGLIIVDECHSASALSTFNMLEYFKNEFNSLIIGFSATPVRLKPDLLKRSCTIFGDGNHIYFISRMSIVDAIDKNIIVCPKFYWIENNLNNLNDNDSNNSYHLGNNNYIVELNDDYYVQIIDHIEILLNEVDIKRIIAWANSIASADKWYKVFKSYKHKIDTHPNIANLELFIAHTGETIGSDNKNGLIKFSKYDKPSMVICCGMAKEGFDEKSVSFVINLDAVKKRSPICFIQQCGRALRNYPGKTKGIFMETFSFIDENKKIEELCNILIGYTILLQQIDINDHMKIDTNYDIVKNSITVDQNKIKISTPQNNYIIIEIKSSTLKSIDWQNLPDKITKQIQCKFYNNNIGYETMKKIIKRLSIKNKKEYNDACLIDNRLPNEPDLIYKGLFLGWMDYLSIDKIYYELDECKNMIKKYLNENTELNKYKFDLAKLCVKLCELDNKFPPNDLWIDYYKIDIIDIFELNKKKQKIKTLI